MPEKKVYDLTVDPEFRDLIPPLNEEELKLLEESLVADGCESPLIVWKGVIIDGHNRYMICQKHDIPFSIQEKHFDTREEVMLWMLRNQLGRRNLNNYQRVELVLKFEPLVKSAAEQRMLAGKVANPVPTLAQGQTKGKTRDHLSEAAGVSHGTFAKAKKLVQSADEETKRELRAGKVTVNRAYTELLEKEHEGETKICERCKQEKSLSAFSIPSNRRSFSSVCRDCEKEISAVAKSAAEAAAKPADIAASSEPPCPIPGMVMHNGAPIHVERPLPDTPEMFRYVADLVKSCCDSYVIGLTSAMRRYSSGMGSEEHNAQILEMVRRTNAQVLTILNKRMEEQ
nr:MAG TPA: putative chromosome-partitioning protein [Bacteriophage sp.]